MENKDRWIPLDPNYSEEGALERLKKCKESEEYKAYSKQSQKECDTLIKAYEGDPTAQEEATQWYGVYESELEAYEKTMNGWIHLNINKGYLKDKLLNGQTNTHRT